MKKLPHLVHAHHQLLGCLRGLQQHLLVSLCRLAGAMQRLLLRGPLHRLEGAVRGMGLVKRS